MGALAVLSGTGALPQGELDPVPVLRAARSDWEEGARAAAARALLAIQGGVLADHASLLRARLLREESNLDEARQAADLALSYEPPSEVRARVYQEIALIELARDDLLAAYRAQRSGWEASRSRHYAARLVGELADEFASRGLPGDALRLYRKLWQTWPLSEESQRAFERSREITLATGAPAADAKSLIRLARRLRESFRCERALLVHDLVLARETLDDGLRSKAERGRADCLFQRRRYREAASTYARLSAANPRSTDLVIRAARADNRAGDREQALRRLASVARRSDRKARAHARYLTALMLLDQEPATARRLLRRVQKQKAAPSFARLARWRLAWADYRARKFEAALWWLAPLTKGSIWDIEVQRARYWTAVTRLETDPAKGGAALEKLARALPLSYYGLLAADRLGTEPEVERGFLGDRDGAARFEHETRATWLIEGGFPDAARDELESWLRKHRLDRAERLAAAPLLHQLGDHFRAVRLVVDGFGGSLEEGIDPGWRDVWRNAWPQVFGLSVRSAAQEFDFESALVYAVMREESTYRPAIRSPAGALGLMQIIPPTATRIARRLGVEDFAVERLVDPRTNIRFGTYYLKELLQQFDGSQPLAIAAYNAGPDAVNSWVSRDGSQPDDLFVDSVPYGETRRYLRRVLRSYRVYRLLYGGAETSSPATAGAQSEVSGDR